MKYIDEVEIKEKAVFIRVDFNVPLDQNLNITDDTRIRAVLPTIHYCLEGDAKVILASHMGRPKGSRKEELSLAPVARRLAYRLHKQVVLSPDCVGPEVDRQKAAMKPGDVLLLENLRFHDEEEKNDPRFARDLMHGVEVYVDDAFAVAHRAHASVEAVTRYAPICVAGFLMRDEVHYFHKAMEDPARPLAALIGGAKISSKLAALKNMLENVDKFIIGGAMANTFLKAKGYEVGQSLVEDSVLEAARDIMAEALKKRVRFYLPVDCVVADKLARSAETKIIPVQEVPPDWFIADIGPATVTLFGEALQNAKTIIWNGPMGAFEYDAFSRGTMAMVQKVADSYALTIVGGGDTDVALHKAGEYQKFSYVSTGGGAFIELLEGKKLPGIQALEKWAAGTPMSERRRLIAANWKMHKTLEEARTLAREVRLGLSPGARVEVVLAPPFTALAAVASELAGSPIGLAGQDTFWERQGAFTGAVSPLMLRDVGCRYVIVGHSERRQYFGETDETVNKKLVAVTAAGLIPIMCIGEKIAERQAALTLEVVRGQLVRGLAGLRLSGEQLVLAYEPVWAIGTGLTATPQQAQEVHAFIRGLLRESLGAAAGEIRVLYGGSVTPDNAATLLAEADIDGALVGGASLTAASFLGIAAAAG